MDQIRNMGALVVITNKKENILYDQLILITSWLNCGCASILNQMVFNTITGKIGVLLQFHFFHDPMSVCAYRFVGNKEFISNVY
jgi:hypothetical protein